jgi:hypothetical protein
MRRPDFVTMSTTPPNRFPYSAGNPPVITFAVSITSGLRPAENTACSVF